MGPIRVTDFDGESGYLDGDRLRPVSGVEVEGETYLVPTDGATMLDSEGPGCPEVAFDRVYRVIKDISSDTVLVLPVDDLETRKKVSGAYCWGAGPIISAMESL